jgi:hypothetical protein
VPQDGLLEERETRSHSPPIPKCTPEADNKTRVIYTLTPLCSSMMNVLENIPL